jgi:annexin-like protein
MINSLINKDFTNRISGVAKYAVIGFGVLLGILLLVWLYKNTIGKYQPRKVPLPTGGQGIPSFSDGTVWSPLRSVEMLYYAMFGSSGGNWWNINSWGTDEDTIFLILGDKTQDQLAAIINAYEEKYTRDLINDFKSELSGSTLSRVLDYFAFVTA